MFGRCRHPGPPCYHHPTRCLGPPWSSHAPQKPPGPPRCLQKPPNAPRKPSNASWMPPRCLRMPPRPPKTMFSLIKTSVFEISTKPLLEVFCAIFGHPGSPFGYPKAARSFPKDTQGPPRILKWRPKSMKNPLRAPLEHLWRPRGAPNLKMTPKSTQNHSKRYPKSLQKAFSHPPGMPSQSGTPQPSHSANNLHLAGGRRQGRSLKIRPHPSG